MKCPKCLGKGDDSWFPIGKASYTPCSRCSKTGILPDDDLWVVNGRKLKAYRIDSSICLRDAAIWLGIEAITLSEMERGITEPDMSISYLPFMLLDKSN